VKTVLIVDDEQSFLLSLRDGLSRHRDRLDLVLAGNGLEAAGVLAQRPVDLLVTDLKLPLMDGFELLAHVSRSHPQIPVIVMTAFGTPEMESRIFGLGALTYLEKPLDLDVLEQSIFAALDAGARSIIRGITLAAFLQLVHLEKKSCSLRVRSHGRVAALFVQQGEVFDAEYDALRGTPAALEILAWEECEIEMENVCRRRERQIGERFEFLLMEACRLKDEGKTSSPPRPVATAGSPSPPPSPGPSAETLLADPALKAPLATMQELLGKVLGPMARIVFRDALDEWGSKHKPAPSNLTQLVEILGREIGDPGCARSYRQLLATHFKPERR
jgi:DNA-binding response OmpR family regulator